MTKPAPTWTIVIHGGAGSMTRENLGAAEDAAARKALAAAIEAGAAILRASGAALDAVQAAVRVLEDDPHFNAGRGSAFTAEGRIDFVGTPSAAQRAAHFATHLNTSFGSLGVSASVSGTSVRVSMAGAAYGGIVVAGI